MRFSVELVPKEPFWRMRVYAATAEGLGYSAVWLSEHFFNRSSVVASTYLALRTRTISIGLGVLNPYAFNPITMAQFVASLTELAPGRVMLSIGAGDPIALSAMGYEQMEPLKKVEEAVKIVKILLSDMTTSGGARLDFRPRGPVPVYVAAQGRRMLELAGRIGDGVLVNSANLPFLEESLKVVRQSASSSGRQRVDVEVEVLTSVHEDRSKAVKTVKPYAAVVLLGMPKRWRERLCVGEELIARLREAVTRGEWLRIHELMPDDLALSLSLAGSGAEVAKSISALPLELMDGLVFGGPLGPYPRRAMSELMRALSELFGKGSRG
jgi:5,10-methylenetetrahydromethanopterin reductase